MRKAVLFALAVLAVTAAPASPIVPIRLGGLRYVSVVDVCAHLGLRLGVSANGRAVILRNAYHSATIAADSHEMILDGVKVYLGDNALVAGGHFYVSEIDYARRLAGLLQPAVCLPIPRRPHVIVLDPGHGGNDPGAQNPRYRLQEKAITLDVALRLRQLLVREGWTVVMTRTRDTQLSLAKIPDLEMRAGLATREHADVFLSIHFDASQRSTVHGSEIISYYPVGQRSTDRWGLHGNDARRETEPGNRNDDWNAALAHCLFRSLPRSLGTQDLGERIKDLSVLRNATCPAVLVEPACIDTEPQRVSDPVFRQRVAEALAAGLRDYARLVDSLQLRTRASGAPAGGR